MSGAGGNWPCINEHVDSSVVRQGTPTSCGPACAVMVLTAFGSKNVTQTYFSTGYYDASRLAAEMAQISGINWNAILVMPGDELAALQSLNPDCPWIAELREPGNKVGHFVVVEFFALGRLSILDPWDQKQYGMAYNDFKAFWTGVAICRSQP